MELTESTLQKNFTVKHKNKTYYVDYLNSDSQILGLLNRDHWQILDEELEEVCIYQFQNATKKEINKNRKLYLKLIKFCIKHFDNYKPNYKGDFQ